MNFNLPIRSEDTWHGFHRYKLDFEGREAWIVEPAQELPWRPWTWCMEWPEAFVERIGVETTLALGYYHVHLQAFGRGCDDDIEAFYRFNTYLVDTLGFEPGARLIGMSYGGLYSLRYATAHPDRVARIYLDAPLCTFFHFAHGLRDVKAPYGLPDDYDAEHDPAMPVNNAEKLTHIPMLLIYGMEDTTVPPQYNCELFVKRFQEAGGHIEIMPRGGWAHHPHGLDCTGPIVRFLLPIQPQK